MEARRSPRLRAKEPSILADAAESAAGRPGSTGGWLVRHRSLLLLIALVLHKCATDGLTRWTRLQTSYSGATVAVLSEVFKFPLIVAAICSIGGGASQIAPVFKEALSKPLGNCWIALCYTFNNLLYFDALSALSAVAYQVLSQSKTVFTAGLMFLLVGKRLRLRQVLAIGMLIAGAVTVNMQELARASASATAAGVAPAAVLWGVFLVLFSSFISALPNVAYEKARAGRVHVPAEPRGGSRAAREGSGRRPIDGPSPAIDPPPPPSPPSPLRFSRQRARTSTSTTCRSPSGS